MTDGRRDHIAEHVPAGAMMRILRKIHDFLALPFPMEAR